MSTRIYIGNKPIDFPTSATEPNWAPSVVDFAKSTADSINGLNSNIVVPPSVMRIDGSSFDNPLNTHILFNNVYSISPYPEWSVVSQTGTLLLVIEIAAYRTTDTNGKSFEYKTLQLGFDINTESYTMLTGDNTVSQLTFSYNPTSKKIEFQTTSFDNFGTSDPTHTGFIHYTVKTVKV